MRLIRVTDKLYLNPERVLAVEERTIDNGRGVHTFVEITMETMIRWRIEDLPLEQVLHNLDPVFTPRPTLR